MLPGAAGDVRFSGYICRVAVLPISTGNTFDWLAAELDWATPGFRDEAPLPWEPTLLGEAIQLVLRPHSVLVLRDGDTLNLIAERYGTTVATLRRINPQLESTQTITSGEGDSLAVLAGRHGTTASKLRSLNPVLQQSEPYATAEGETLSSVASEQQLSLSLLRQFNPELASWPSEEPLPTGSTLLLPVYRSTTPLPAGLQLQVPGYLPSTPLPAGEWIDLPARRSGPQLDELTDPPG